MKRTLGLASLVVGLGLSGSASAYVLLVPNRTWQVQPVNVEINTNRCESSITLPDPDCGRTATMDALNSTNGWNGPVPGLVDATLTATPYVIGDYVPTVSFNDPLGICTGSCLAATLTGYYSGVGANTYIDDADIFVTKRIKTKFTSEAEIPAGGACLNQYYIEGVMVHELGHALGLGHSALATATMNAFAIPCEPTLDEIDADDEAGIIDLY